MISNSSMLFQTSAHLFLRLWQWVQRWAVPYGCVSPRPSPPPGRSPVSWLICRAQWWASAWGCWSCGAMRNLCINSAPGGSSSSPSSPSSSSPSSGTFSLTSCSGYRSRPLPDDTPPSGGLEKPRPPVQHRSDLNLLRSTSSGEMDVKTRRKHFSGVKRKSILTFHTEAVNTNGVEAAQGSGELIWTDRQYVVH